MLDLTKLNDGDIVIVTENITNPSPDKRTRGNWTLAETIPKGMKLQVRIRTLDYYYDMGEDIIARLRESRSDDTLNGDTPWRYELGRLGGSYGFGLSYNNKGKVPGLATGRKKKTDKLAHMLLSVLKPQGDDTPLGDLLLQKKVTSIYRSCPCGILLAILVDNGKLDLADVRMAITIHDNINVDNGDWDAFTKRHAL